MNEERAGKCLRQVEHIHGNMLASLLTKDYDLLYSSSEDDMLDVQ
jgi:hypothetical protein